MPSPAAPWDVLCRGYQGMFPCISPWILLGAVGPPQGQAAPWCSCPGGSQESVALPLFLSVVWNPGMDRRPVLHMLVLFSLIWGHSGVFQGPGSVSVCLHFLVERGLVAEQPQGPLSVTNMAGRGSSGEEAEGSLHWCL